MKKVLLGTTALVMTAGVAAAEVSLSGYAEMGIRDDGVNDVQFHHDIDVKFSLSGETDSGLSFGATIDLDEVSNGISNNANPSSVWISGSFGTLTMGDTDGALDWAMTEVGALTSIADDHTTHIGYSGNCTLDGADDGQILRYDNSFGDISFAVSLEQDDDSSGEGDTFAIGAKGTFGDFGWGIGHQSNDNTDAMGISLSAGFGDVNAVLNYTDWDIGGVDASHTGLGVTYTSGALSLHANYGEFDVGGLTADGFGIAANYDLGGGAVAMFGYGDSSVGGVSLDTWSAGLGLSF